MKLNDHLDFHKLPFDKEKIRERVEKIAADCMHWVTGRQNARPLLAMVLCTCIAFSAMLPYIPVIAPAETSPPARGRLACKSPTYAPSMAAKVAATTGATCGSRYVRTCEIKTP